MKINPRGLCLKCLRPPLTCYCKLIQPFDAKIKFVILIHGREVQNRIATGRISHLLLENSELIAGYDYSENKSVNDLIAKNPNSFVLYPGAQSLNLSESNRETLKSNFSAPDEIQIFVIDGTWTTARKTMQRSKNLQKLKQICFHPNHPSRFRLRKQPLENCFSTVEAIHQTIEILAPFRNFSLSEGLHHRLIQVFDHMVDQQIELSKQPKMVCKWYPPSRKQT